MDRSVLAAAVALFLSPALSAQTSDCGTSPAIVSLGGGSAGSFGVPQLLSTGTPAIGLPFTLRIDGAAPGSFGALAIGAGELGLPLPDFGATFFPAPPLISVGVTTDGAGASDLLFPLVALSAEVCGAELVAQGFVVDASAAGGAAFTDALRLTLGAPAPALVGAAPPQPSLDVFVEATTAPTVVLTGQAPGAVEVELLAPAGRVLVPVVADSFAATVALAPDRANRIFVRSLSPAGVASSPRLATVIRDLAPPSLTVDFPADGASTSSATVDVAGRVGDLLSGTMPTTVTVNGVAAMVTAGRGVDSSFLAADVPLAAGATTALTVVATDAHGNQAVAQIDVAQSALSGNRIEPLSATVQSGAAGATLPAPLEVLVTRADGQPFEGKPVAFHVEGGGSLMPLGGGAAAQVVTATADAAGVARVIWTLGADAGAGNGRVVATSAGLAGVARFVASADAGPAERVTVIGGQGQVGIVGEALVESLVGLANDGRNVVDGATVVASVVSGGGTVGGFASTTATSDLIGRAAFEWVLGPEPGVQRVELTVLGSSEPPAVFEARAIAPGAATTSLRGVVLDGARRAVEGADVSVQIGASQATTATGPGGAFEFTDLPGYGPATLRVDGSAATALGGSPIGSTTLGDEVRELLLHAGADNLLQSGLLLPNGVEADQRFYSTATPTELGATGVAGLVVTIAPGSMNDGASPAPDGAAVAMRSIHVDDLARAAGANPALAWSIEPASATFDPPATVTAPNVGGLPAGAKVILYGSSAALGRLAPIGTGTVGADGATISSDAGAGLRAGGSGFFAPLAGATTEIVAELGSSTSALAPVCSGDSYAARVVGLFAAARSGVDCDAALDGSPTELADHGACVDAYAACLAAIEAAALALPGTGVTPLTAASAEAGAALGFAQQALDSLWVELGLGGSPSFNLTFVAGDAVAIVDELAGLRLDVDVLVEGADALTLAGLVGGSFEPAAMATLGGAGAVGLLTFDSVGAGGFVARVQSLALDRALAATARAGARTAFVEDLAQVSIGGAPAGGPALLRPVVEVFGTDLALLASPSVGQSATPPGPLDFGALEFSPSPVFVASLDAGSEPMSLDSDLSSGALVPVATFDDGSTAIAVDAASGTTYRSSSASIAAVNAVGGVDAVGDGIAYVGAFNDGAVAVRRVEVDLDDLPTVVVGWVQDDAGVPVAGADVFIAALGTTQQTDADGRFEFVSVPTDVSELALSVSAGAGAAASAATVVDVDPVPGGVTDVGVIVLEPAVVWIAPGDGDWFDGANWSTGSVPGAGDQVIIANAGAAQTVTISAPGAVAKGLRSDEELVIGPGASLEVAELLTQRGSLRLQPGATLGDTAVSVGGLLSARNALLRDVQLLEGGPAGLVELRGTTTLDGCALDGQATHRQEAQIRILNGFELNGRYEFQNAFVETVLTFEGDQSLFGSGELGSETGSTVFRTFVRPAGGTLTIEAGLTLRGGSFTVGDEAWPLVNRGSIVVDPGEHIRIYGDGWVNEGSIAVGANSELGLLGSGWVNVGTIEASGSDLQLAGQFDVAAVNQLGQPASIDFGGFVEVATLVGGELDLTGLTADVVLFDVDFDGVTIDSSKAIEIRSSSVLQGCTLNTDVETSGFTVLGGLTLNGNLELENGVMTFTGQQTLAGSGVIDASGPPVGSFLSRMICEDGTLTIAPELSILAGSLRIGSPASTFVNHADVVLQSGERFELEGLGWVNDGSIDSDGGEILFAGSGWQNSGAIDLNGGMLEVEGELAPANIGPVAGTGTLRIGGSIVGATIDAAAFAVPVEVVDAELTNVVLIGTPGLLLSHDGGADTVLRNCRVEGEVEIGPNQTVFVEGTLTIDGVLRIDTGALFGPPPGGPIDVRFLGDVSILGTGELVGATVPGTIDFHYPGQLTIGPDATVRGDGMTFRDQGGSLVNHGSIVADGAVAASGDIAIETLWVNHGTLGVVNGGELVLSGELGTSFGRVEAVGPGAVFGVGGNPFAQVGTLTQSGGEISIRSGASFVGERIDLSGGVAELEGFLFASLDNGGTVRIAGDGIGQLELLGGYTQLSGGSIEFDVGGQAPGSEHDALIVGSALTVDGTLDVDLANGFVPVLGDAFTLVTSQGTAGTFASLDLPLLAAGLGWQVEAVGTETTLTVVAQP